MTLYIYLGLLLEDNFHGPTCSATIELEDRGYVKYNFGDVLVKYPTNVSLKRDTLLFRSKWLLCRAFSVGFLLQKFR